jgi:hypothetical protein
MDDSPQGTLNPNEYRCAMCGNVYAKEWTDEEAQSETQAYWPGVAQQDCAVMCDDCWQQVAPETHPVEYQASVLELEIQQAYAQLRSTDNISEKLRITDATLEKILTAFAIPPAISALLLKPMESSNSTYEEAYKRWIAGEYRKTYRYPDDFAVSPSELGELSNTNRMSEESQEEAYRRLIFGEKKR